MRKKLLSILLTVTLMATTLMGCGAEDDSNAVISLDELAETISVTEAESSVEASSATEDNAGNSVNAEITDWATAYDNYFDENYIYRDDIMVSTSVIQDGVEMSVKMAFSDEAFYMGYDFGRAAVDIYGTADAVYSKSVMGSEETWSYATITSEEEAESVKSMGTTTEDNDSIVSWTYKEVVTEDDIVYDVLDVIIKSDDEENQNIICYVNRETQKIDKIIMDQDGTEAILIVEDIEGVEIPEEAKNAKESTVEDIMMELVATMIAVSAVAPQ